MSKEIGSDSGHHDYLAFFFCEDKERDELVENGFRIQILFRLIDDERPVIGVVEGEVQKQKDNSAGPGRELGDVDESDPISLDTELA